MDITGRLENWKVQEAGRLVWGNLYDDVRGRWKQGQRIHTSSLPGTFDMSKLKEGQVITTLNSVYLLGTKWVEEGRGV